MPTSKHSRKIAQAKRWLKKHFPLKTPIRIIVVDELPECHGICLLGGGRALIKIKRASPEFMCEVLLEEYAHVAREECPIPSNEDHDPLFWAVLAAITKQWRGE